ncbi:MAG: hypothetical protein D6820_07020 [Lentisphaerae bacterium]|nr:MAG: hypothetical protein D6820_07020 [Lentisphaerota bacterium]
MNFKKTAAEAVDPLLVGKRRLREIMWQYSLYVSRPFTKRSELLDVSLQQWPSSWEYQMMVTPLRGYNRGILFLFFDIPTEKLGLSITPRLPSKTMLCYRILVTRQESE